ncbi:carboxymuconolactone decarboxylase family protein [Streptomyces orinoci]|uniref:Carboxymuconolactone decarboxylase family protein n=1 Tax=Streptomyces orinoci TaxID=67339 RepID=A0ABV3JU75_STRON|nr:carboxymuconolactone decarboxylase family protein [Streptomyces orinoci]
MSSPRQGKLPAEVYQAMYAATGAAKKGLDPALVELILIRASQLNHCAYCIDMHIKDALAGGEREERIHLLAAWEEATGIYTEAERAALALTEAVTVLTDGFVPDEVYARAAEHFDPTQLSHLVSLIGVINFWNRFNVAFRTPPGHQR